MSGWLLPTSSGAGSAERRFYALWRLAYLIGALSLVAFVVGQVALHDQVMPTSDSTASVTG